jgi:hypothetical protein
MSIVSPSRPVLRKLVMVPSALLFFAVSAAAIERYDLERTSCLQIKKGLDRESPTVLRHASKNVPGMKIFDLYVGRHMYCPGEKVTQRRSVFARDGSCEVFQCERVGKDPGYGILKARAR